MRRDSSLRFQAWRPHLSEALAGEAVGLVDIEGELWKTWFRDYKMSVLDAAEGKLWSVGSAGRLPAAIQAALEAGEVCPIRSI